MINSIWGVTNFDGVSRPQPFFLAGPHWSQTRGIQFLPLEVRTIFCKISDPTSLGFRCWFAANLGFWKEAIFVRAMTSNHAIFGVCHGTGVHLDLPAARRNTALSSMNWRLHLWCFVAKSTLLKIWYRVPANVSLDHHFPMVCQNWLKDVEGKSWMFHHVSPRYLGLKTKPVSGSFNFPRGNDPLNHSIAMASTCFKPQVFTYLHILAYIVTYFLIFSLWAYDSMATCIWWKTSPSRFRSCQPMGCATRIGLAPARIPTVLSQPGASENVGTSIFYRKTMAQIPWAREPKSRVHLQVKGKGKSSVRTKTIKNEHSPLRGCLVTCSAPVMTFGCDMTCCRGSTKWLNLLGSAEGNLHVSIRDINWGLRLYRRGYLKSIICYQNHRPSIEQAWVDAHSNVKGHPQQTSSNPC